MSAVASAVGTEPDESQRELGARRWQQPVLEAFQIATESLLWFVVIGVMATSAERTFLEDLLDQTRLLEEAEIGDQREAAVRASGMLVEAIDGAQAGPPYLAFLLAAVGGFLLVRLLSRARITGAFSGIVILIASILGLNALLHLGLASDLRFWDSSGLIAFLDQPGRYFSGSFDAEGFVADPQLKGAHGSALTASGIGLIGAWLRFLWIGRSTVTVSTVLRSFTFGFAVMIVAIIFARLEGTGTITLAAIPYFVLGVLTMAAAQAARASFGVQGVRKTTPWVVSMAVTGLTLLAVGTLLGLLALLDAKSLLQAIGGVIGAILEVVLLIILTPIFWIVEPILRFLLPEGLGGLFGDEAGGPLGEQAEEVIEENDSLFGVPSWFRPLMQLLGLGALLLGFYVLARRIVRRREDDGGEYEEDREQMDGAATGVGSLLRNLLRRGGPKPDDRSWLRRHVVYRLFARAEFDSRERGLARLDGETPVEFAALATRTFDEPLFERIAAEFDRARYGRHYPDEDDLRPLADALLAWETANPPTEELRYRLQGAAVMDEDEDFRFRLEMARRAVRNRRAEDSTERMRRN